MVEFLKVGIVIGIIMYLGKLGSLELLLLKFPKTRRFLHSSPVILFFMDLGFNLLALELVSMAGGLTAMIAGVTFQAISIIFCFSIYAKNKYITPLLVPVRSRR